MRGSTLLSENRQTRVDHPPRPRRAHSHRHVLDYFGHLCSADAPPARARRHHGRIHLRAGETRHETYGKGEFKVHDLENLSDKDMVFMTVEFRTAPISR
jgi:hypothetical protein